LIKATICKSKNQKSFSRKSLSFYFYWGRSWKNSLYFFRLWWNNQA